MKNHLSTGAALHADHYRPDLDGLRAVAVLSVVIGHVFPHVLPGGFIGVDIFFVISGYLITSILIRDIEADRFSILHFYNRRIRRIFPALVTVLVFAMAMGWLVLFRPEFASLGRHVFTSSAFSENFLIWSETGYFDAEAISKPTLHLWSLAIEEQFYILWPLTLAFTHKLRLNRLAVILVAGILSFSLNQWDALHNPDAAYYAPYGRAWELLAGALLAHFKRTPVEQQSWLAYGQSLLGLAVIGLSISVVQPNSHFPGAAALAPVAGTLLLIAAGPASIFNRDGLSSAPMVWVGLVSYSLYLWHWPLLSFACIIFDDPPASIRLPVIGLSLIASLLTFHLIEKPARVRKGGDRIVFFYVGALAVVACAGLLASKGLMPPRLDSFKLPERTEWDFLKSRTPGFKRDGVGIYPLGGNRPAKVLFIGDSHMAQYAERIDHVLNALANAPGAVMAVGGGCIPIEHVVMLNPYRSRCAPLRDEAFGLSDSGNFTTVVLGGAWNWYFRSGEYALDVEGKRTLLNTAEGMNAALKRLEESIYAWKRSGKDVVLLLDNPLSQNNDPHWFANRLSANPQSGFEANRTAPADPYELMIEARLKALASRMGARIIAPRDAICDPKSCTVTDSSGRPIFRDSGHFDPDWANRNATFIDAAVIP